MVGVTKSKKGEIKKKTEGSVKVVIPPLARFRLLERNFIYKRLIMFALTDAEYIYIYLLFCFKRAKRGSMF